jgi:predicted AAA+ superfamily ATPase
MQIASYTFNMHIYISRKIESDIQKNLKDFPVVTILGPRQCGKSTLAKRIISSRKKSVYLDLELESDLRKIEDPELFLLQHEDKLVCIDEIQRMPDLFKALRGIIDQKRRNGRFLILGSASRDLIRQSSETLAGRICYMELTPFLFSEVSNAGKPDLMKLWSRGGFPESFLSRSNQSSLSWRANFVSTFLERDIPQLGFNIPAQTLKRLWTMLAHSHGQLLNSSRLGESIGVSHTTVRSYLDILSQTFMLRVIQPFHANVKKRIIKSAKVYLRDSGILHSLLGIANNDDLFGHPVFGNSWEGFAMENVLSAYPGYSPYFFRTSSGVEVDLMLEKGTKRIAFEFKSSKSPTLSKGFYQALQDLSIKRAYIVSPVDEQYPIRKDVIVAPLHAFIK